MLLPAWFASMVQVPIVRNVTVASETVQMFVLVEVKVTAKPEVAVAESVSGVPNVWTAMAPKVMVWGCALTVKLCATIAAAA